MKKLIYLAFIACVITACSNEDEILTNSILYENIFTITDDPSDPVQHERYLIYKDFNIPVYFNDTISVKETGKDWYGNPVIQYETVDMSWNFTGYDHGVKYEYDYLTTQEEQISALKFVRSYLSICSKPMRPFSIMAADTLFIVSEKEINKPTYKVGFRTLVFSQLGELTDEEAEITANSVIKAMIKDKITANQNLCAKFKAVSDEKKYYGTTWEKLGGGVFMDEWFNKNTLRYGISYLFYGDPYIPEGASKSITDFVDTAIKYGHAKTKEEAIAARSIILQEIGAFGFITDGVSRKHTPEDANSDRNDFITAILNLGADGFSERYGASPLVMKKFAILYDYITNELDVQL